MLKELLKIYENDDDRHFKRYLVDVDALKAIIERLCSSFTIRSRERGTPYNTIEIEKI